MTCVADARAMMASARRSFLAFPSVYGASLLSPAESPEDRWTLELALGPVEDGDAPDGLGPELALVQYRHGLTVVECTRRSPTETRVVLAA